MHLNCPYDDLNPVFWKVSDFIWIALSSDSEFLPIGISIDKDIPSLSAGSY